ncbi:hypothetical protein D3C79_1039240 [compost metagenome]
MIGCTITNTDMCGDLIWVRILCLTEQADIGCRVRLVGLGYLTIAGDGLLSTTVAGNLTIIWDGIGFLDMNGLLHG